MSIEVAASKYNFLLVQLMKVKEFSQGRIFDDRDREELSSKCNSEPIMEYYFVLIVYCVPTIAT